MIYLIGSLRNPEIPEVANLIQEQTGIEVFASWFSAGEVADDRWKSYEEARGFSYREALSGYAARHVFEFDLFHLKRADTVVLVMPAGKSGFLELGWSLGQRKRGYILLDDSSRWDVMLQFATGIYDSLDALVNRLRLDRLEESQ